MALNDEADRLATAEEYLLTYSPNSQEFDAALEHVFWVHKTKPELKKRAADILVNVIKVRCEEKNVLNKISGTTV